MKLQDLEAISKSKFVIAYNSPPAVRREKSKLLDHDVVLTKVLFAHEGKEAQLELWIVVASQAVVLAGPETWLDAGVDLFCRHDQDLADFLIYQMDKVWGEAHCQIGSPDESLEETLRRIPRVSHVPLTMPPSAPPTCRIQCDIELA